MTDFEIGDHVRLKHDIVDSPSGDSPGCICARAGELLIVRSVNHNSKLFPISVSHPGRHDNSFSVYPSEIYKDINSNLKHQRT